MLLVIAASTTTNAADWPADEEDVIYALNAKDTARSLGLQQGAAKVFLHP